MIATTGDKVEAAIEKFFLIAIPVFTVLRLTSEDKAEFSGKVNKLVELATEAVEEAVENKKGDAHD